MNIFNDWLNTIELPVLKSFHGFLECDFLDNAFPLITSLCNYGIVWIIIGIVLIIFKRMRKTGITILLSLILGLVLCNCILQPSIMRLRPYVVDPGIKLLISPETTYSFPSGHTIASFEAAFSIFLNNKKIGIPALLLALIISLSRLYLLMHYFTDVLASVILGFILSFISYTLINSLYKKYRL